MRALSDSGRLSVIVATAPAAFDRESRQSRASDATVTLRGGAERAVRENKLQVEARPNWGWRHVDKRHGAHLRSLEEASMAAMKPRTGDGPLEVTKEGRGIVMRVPLEGGGRLVVEMTPDEASALGNALKSVVD